MAQRWQQRRGVNRQRALSCSCDMSITCCRTHRSGVAAVQDGRGSWPRRVAGQHSAPVPLGRTLCNGYSRSCESPLNLKGIKNGRQPTDQKRKISFPSFQYLEVNTVWQCILFPFSRINKTKFWNFGAQVLNAIQSSYWEYESTMAKALIIIDINRYE